VLASKLVRPYPNRMLGTPITYTKEKYGRVPAVYIRYSQDHGLFPAAQEYIVTHYGPFREVVELDGGHFDFLQRPKEFTKLLANLAKKYTQ
jgi:pimeloyl-ACP methyl ester carboxylesterase